MRKPEETKTDNKSRKPRSANRRPNPKSTRGKQGKKDSRDPRVNFDNERVSKFDKFMDDHSNDIAWYSRFPALMKSAANISYYGNTGEKLPFGSGNANPGVMVFNYSPYLFGDGGTALNQAANSNFSFTVHANSRNTRYNAPDQQLLSLAGADALSFLALGIRVYGTMKNWEQMNYYTPKALVSAMGFDFDDLESNLSNMWFDLNDMIAQSHQIWLPNNMPIVARRFWMNTNIYEDADSIKSQYYLYSPDHILIYDETRLNTGGCLRPMTYKDAGLRNDTTGYVINLSEKTTNPNGLTWDEYKKIFFTMLGALLNSEDRGIIYGDILKAYGEGSLYTVSPIDATYKTVPVPKHAEVLSQFENLTVNPVPYTGIAQSNGGVELIPFCYYAESIPPTTDLKNDSRNFMGTHALLNFHQLNFPTPEQIVVATRCMSLQASPTFMSALVGSATSLATAEDDQRVYFPNSCGTEIISSITVYYYNYTSNSERTLKNAVWNGQYSNLSTEFLRAWTKFDWAPFIYTQIEGDDPQVARSSTAPERFDFYGDVDNYTTIDATTLAKMHKAALYSLVGMVEN